VAASRIEREPQLNAERWQQVCEILDAAIPLDAAARVVCLDRACANDPALRHEVNLLLHSHDAAGDFLQAPPAEFIAESFASLPPPNLRGRRLGVYDILEEIGRGGMGDVYRAVRADGQYNRQVAIKVVRVGWSSALLLEHFRQERQILATLEHPNIARLYDGGTSDDGLPYLVMELIEGEPIDVYCDRLRLNVEERVRLFRQVCDAVQYAHQRLVIHRDIKPGNILVTHEGVPKLLDFGVAKFLQIGEQPANPTQFRPLTPAYASPEQVRGEALTTASDVYSLGVVLYELLTGCSPYRSATRTALEISRAVAEAELQRPSTALKASELRGPGQSTATISLDAISRARASSPSRLQQQLSGDLDAIVLNALRREAERRYGSVQQFADDLDRHLRGLPVVAIRGSWRYQLTKFAARNRTIVAAGATVLVTLIGGIIVSTHQARVAQTERARAEARFNDIRKLANSLIFDVNDAMADTPGNTPVRRLLLDRAVVYLDKLTIDAAGNPDLQRELAWGYQKLADVQGNDTEANLGQVKAAELSLRKAVTLFAAVAHARPTSIEDGLNLAMIHRAIATSDAYYPNGRKEIAQAIAITSRLAALDPKSIKVTQERSVEFVIQGITQNVSGDREMAAQSMRVALSLAEDALRADPRLTHIHEDIAKAKVRFGMQLSSFGLHAEAERQLQAAVDDYQQLASRAAVPELVRASAQAHSFLSQIESLRGLSVQAKQNIDAAFSLAAPLAAADPSNNGLQWLMVNLACERGRQLILGGRFREGIEQLQPGFALYAKDTEDDAGPGLGVLRAWQGHAYAGLHEYPRALQEFRQSIAVLEKDVQYADARSGVAADYVMIGGTLLAQRQYQGATEAYQQALAKADLQFTLSHTDTPALYPIADAQAGLGDVAIAQANASRTTDARARYRTAACAYYGQSLATWHRIVQPGRFSPSQFPSGDPLPVRQQCAQCGCSDHTTH
jgi:non-specific serine/threonine protein kinase/serine/threonine-protein kinase